MPPELIDLTALAAHSRLRVRSAEDLGACLVGESGGLRLLFRVEAPQAMATLLGEVYAETTTLEVQATPVLKLGESRLLPPLLPGEFGVALLRGVRVILVGMLMFMRM